jgi:hypothetical protein
MSFDVIKAETVKQVSGSEEFAFCVGQLARFQTVVPKMRVEDAGTKALASETLVQLMKTEKKFEEMRKSAKGPYFEMGKTIDNLFKPLVETCERMRNELAGRMLEYGQKEREEYEKRQKEAMKAEIVAQGVGEEQPPVQVLPPESVVKTDSGKTFVRKRLKFEVVDGARLIKAALDRRNQIPAAVATVNEAKLRECVNGKLYSIKSWAKYGVRVYEVEEVTTSPGG